MTITQTGTLPRQIVVDRPSRSSRAPSADSPTAGGPRELSPDPSSAGPGRGRRARSGGRRAPPGRRAGRTPHLVGTGRRRPVALLSRLLVSALAASGLLVVAFLFRDALAESLSTLDDLRWRWVPLLLIAQFVSMAAPAVNTFLLLRSAGARVRLPAVLAVTYASNAISVSVPLAGPQLATANTYRQLVRHGADTAATAWTLLVSGLAATSTFAVLAVVSVAATGNPAAVALAGGGALLGLAPVVLLLALLRRPAARRRAEAMALRLWWAGQQAARRPATGTAGPLREFLGRLADHRLPRRQGATVLGIGLLNWLADGACLALAVVAVGAPVPWQGVLLAYVAATAVGSLRLTPGGLGVVEAALTAGLVNAGLDLPHALAAALVYRLVSYWIVVVAGWAAFFASSTGRSLRPATPVRPAGAAGSLAWLGRQPGPLPSDRAQWATSGSSAAA